MPSKPIFPEWFNWDLLFTPHAERRMEERGVSELELRAILERATSHQRSAVEGRYMIFSHRYVIIVEPDFALKNLVVVTVYKVSP